MFRWSIVSILILLCQGFVFETDDYPPVFEVLIFLMIISGFIGAVTSFFRRKQKNMTTKIISRQSLALLPNQVILSTFITNCYSKFAAGGLLDFDVEELRTFLRPRVCSEVVKAADNTGYVLKSNINVILECLPESIAADEFNQIVSQPIPPYHEICLLKDVPPGSNAHHQHQLGPPRPSGTLRMTSDARF
jgi:hypothetical protein